MSGRWTPGVGPAWSSKAGRALRRALPAIVLGALLSALAPPARAQETVFNVPSPDALVRGQLYFAIDQYLDAHAEGETPAFLLFRGVFGAGHVSAVGFNAGAFEYRRPSQPFLDVAVKWRPISARSREPSWGGIRGAPPGRQRRGRPAQRRRGHAPQHRLRGRVHRASGEEDAALGRALLRDARCLRRSGPLRSPGGLRQALPWLDGLQLAVDWYSSRGGLATAGFMWSNSRFNVCVGYGFANAEAAGDLVALEFAVYF